MKRTKCEECGGKISKKNVEFKLYEESVGFFPADVCSKCGEEVFDEETSDKIDEATKEKGLWGLESKAKITEVGSSIAVVINKRIAQFIGLKKGEEVYLHPESRSKISIEV
ncbi:MAG: hypothetical protein AABX39_06580 [Nanoarchaeota archaeon]